MLSALYAPVCQTVTAGSVENGWS